MSDSVRPQRWQPTRLPRPWDSPDKNTGVGCHFLLQYMKVKSESEVAQLCSTLCDPMDCSLPGSSIHGIFQARIPEWAAIAFSTHKLTLQNRAGSPETSAAWLTVKGWVVHLVGRKGVGGGWALGAVLPCCIPRENHRQRLKVWEDIFSSENRVQPRQWEWQDGAEEAPVHMIRNLKQIHWNQIGSFHQTITIHSMTHLHGNCQDFSRISSVLAATPSMFSSKRTHWTANGYEGGFL